MKLRDTLKEFKRHLKRSGVAAMPPTPVQGATSILAFYRDVRVANVDLESNGDMLLFQWGTYDWGEGPMFEFDVTRQVIGSGAEDDDIWQLHLTYRFAPSKILRAVGKGDRWCSRPSESAAFQRFIESHAATAAVGSSEKGQVRLAWECAG